MWSRVATEMKSVDQAPGEESRDRARGWRSWVEEKIGKQRKRGRSGANEESGDQRVGTEVKAGDKVQRSGE